MQRAPLIARTLRAAAVAAAALLLSGCEKGTSDWVADLLSEEEFTRLLAATALQDVTLAERGAALEPLLRVLDDSSVEVKLAAHAALVRLAPASVPELLELLSRPVPVEPRRGAPEYYVRERAAFYVAGVGPSVAAGLAAVVLKDTTVDRELAVRTLGSLGAPALPHLLQLQRAADPRAPDLARSGLSALFQRAPEAAIDALVAASGEPEPVVVAAAEDALDRLATAPAASLPALGEVIRRLPQLRAKAFQPWVRSLLYRFGASDPEIRRAAALELAGGGPEVLGALVQAVGDGDKDVKAQAVSALLVAGVPGFEALLAAGDPARPAIVELLPRAAAALKELAVAPLARALSVANPPSLRAALLAAAGVDAALRQPLAERIAGLAEHSDPLVAEAARALR